MKAQRYDQMLIDRRTGEELKKIRTVSIFESEAENLNQDSEVTGIKYVLEKKAKAVTPEVNEPVAPKATDPEPKKSEKDLLWDQIKALNLPQGDLPHHASGEKKLQEFLDKHKA
jgi:hypothetical protein